MKLVKPIQRTIALVAIGCLALLTATSATAQTAGGTFGDTITVQAQTTGDTIPTSGTDGTAGIDVDHNFDTELGTTGGTYIHDPLGTNPAEIALSAGRHLVLYNAEFNDEPGANRAEIFCKLNLAGNDLVTGRSQAYIRDLGGSDNCISTGAAIITVANDGDVLKLQSYRTDNNTQTVNRTPGAITLQALKIDDAWNHLSLEKDADETATVSSTYAPVVYDNEVRNTGTAFTVDFAGSFPQDITLNEDGLYLVLANTGLEKINNGTRTGYIQHLTLDFVEVPGSRVTTYMRGDANDNDCNNGMASTATIVSATAGQILNVEVAKVSGQDSTIQGGETAITIVKLPDEARYLSLLDTTSQPINDATADPVVFNTQDNPGTPWFSHTAGDSAVTVNDTSKYLFLGNLFTEDDAADNNADRVVVRTGWQLDGTGGLLPYGQGAEYLRDDDDCHRMGNWCGAILDLDAGQTVQMMTERLGNGDPAEGDEMSLIAIPLDILDPSLLSSGNPDLAINRPLALQVTDTATITPSLLTTFDSDTVPSGLTYTVTAAPSNGALSASSFTQQDIIDGSVTFTAGSTASMGSFDFSVTDGTNSANGTFMIDVLSPAVVLSIAPNANEVTEGGTASWTVTSDLAPVGAPISVDIAYSGTADDGTDFTSVATLDILAGATTGILNVNTASDAVHEGCELVIATITGATATTVRPFVGTPASAPVTIVDASVDVTASNLVQFVLDAGMTTPLVGVPIGNVVVSNPDAGYQSIVNTTVVPYLQYNGLLNVTTFRDGSTDDYTFNDPGYADAPGMSIDLDFIPQTDDLTGTVLIAEFGGQQNGTSILLVDGIPHLLSKAGAANEDFPTDSDPVTPGIQDFDWGPVGAEDNSISVPLSGTALTAGVPARIAVVYDITGGSVKWSVNGGAEASAALLNQDNILWHGANTTSFGTKNAEVGGQNTSTTANPFQDTVIKNLAGGFGAISCLRLWNESTGSTSTTMGSFETVTATLTIDGYVDVSSGILTAVSGNGETFDILTGVWTITGGAGAVNAALADVSFTTNTATADPTIIDVSITDGTATVTGAIALSSTNPTTVYVDDDFVPGPIADADNGTPVTPATFGFDAFTNLTDALTALDPAGTVVVNGGDYSTETVDFTGTTALRLTDVGEAVAIGALGATATNGLDIQNGNLTVGAAGLNTIIDCPIAGTTGTLTKVGPGDIRLRGASTFTGVTTINDGRIVITYLDATTRGSLASTGIVVNDPAILALGAARDTVYTHSNPISGTGVVSSFEDGTLIFDHPGPNTFEGGFDLGDGAISGYYTGGPDGDKQGFVVVNHSDHLGTGKILARGGQLRAGASGIVIPNDIDVTNGGFRCGGLVSEGYFDFGFSGQINPIGNNNRGYGNYGLEGLDLFISGPINLDDGNVLMQGANDQDNGTWTVTGDISGAGNLESEGQFDNGVVTFSGAHTHLGTTRFETGITYFNGTSTGGAGFTVTGNGTLAGTGSTDAAVTVDGTLSPGDPAVNGGIGTFTTGGLILNGNLVIDVNDTSGSGHDQVQVSAGANGLGTVDIFGSLLVNEGGVEAGPATVTVVDNTTGLSVAWTPTNLGPLNEFSVDYMSSGKLGIASEIGGDGDDVTLAAGADTAIGLWRGVNFGSQLNSGNGANDSDAGDLDTVINLLEFGFGTDPNVISLAAAALDGSAPGLPVVDASGAPDLVWVQRKDAGDLGSVIYTPEFSVDLQDEFTDDLTPPTIGVSINDDYELVSLPFPAGAQFARVRVELVE